MKTVYATRRSTLAALALGLTGCQTGAPTAQRAAILEREDPAMQAKLRFDGEVRFGQVKQLTFSGENAEAYFNGDGTELIFQSTRDGLGCDQIFRMDVDGRNQRMVSTGKGRTTCSYIFPNMPRIIYSSTHGQLEGCPQRPDYSQGYVWRLQPELEMYIAQADGQSPKVFLPHPGYDAEAVVSPQGDRILFTSTRDGDVDIYSAKPDGSDLKRLTTEVGYDGGAFFSPDGSKIIYRAHHPKSPEALKTYKDLLAQDLVRPSVMELFVMNADGSDKRQITNNGAANFAPYFHPDGERVIFSSNMDDPRGRDFDLYMINIDGTGLERVTYNPSFDSFPMFSRDGKKLVFASNRNAKHEGDTNVFVVDWVEQLPTAQAARLKGQAEIEAQTWSARAARLSDPKLEGRGLGSPGLEAAAAYLSAQFEMIGLKPAGDQGQYLQAFEVPSATTVKRAELKIGGAAVGLDEAFRPLGFSASGAVSGQAIAVGYGVQADELGYDDYAGIDVKDKVVVALRHEPAHFAAALGLKAGQSSRYSDLRMKAIIARQRGAKALIIVNDPAHYAGEQAPFKDALLSLQSQGVSGEVGLPVVHMSWAAAQVWLKPLGLAQREAEVTASKAASAPREGAALQVALTLELEQTKTKAHNVVGRLAAREDGAPTERALIIGAHYDHLGHADALDHSMYPGQLHPGADDNASGVATILELAEALASIKGRQHDVYVVAFTAEESGLLGSAHFAQALPLPQSRVLAMLNFDMVGRFKGGGLSILGADTATEFRALLRKSLAAHGMSAKLEGTGYGPSDFMSFTLKQIPVLSFFTGLHEDYHSPTDTAEKLDAPGAVQITQLAYTIAQAILAAPTPPQLTAGVSQAQGHHHHQGHTRQDSGTSGGERSYGPYFGSIPSFGQSAGVKGALISGVKPGSPAEAAGLKGGDVIVKFGEDSILSMQEYAMSLRKYKPGDKVKVVVMREGKALTLEATLGKR